MALPFIILPSLSALISEIFICNVSIRRNLSLKLQSAAQGDATLGSLYGV